MEPITFTNAGYTLAGHYFTPEAPKPLALLFIHGWRGSENLETAQAVCDRGYSVLTYDMRGNKLSEGNFEDFSRRDFTDDSLVAFDFLKSKIGPGVPIAIVGSSFGSYTAALLAGQRPVRGLSLRVPANYPDEGYNEPQETHRSDTNDFMKWRQQPLQPEDNMALQALHEFTGPVQIIEAEADEMVAHQTVLNFKQAVADPGQLTYIVMKGAPHRLLTPEHMNEYNHLLLEWIDSL